MQTHTQTSSEISEVKDTEISLFNNCKATNSTAITIDRLFALIRSGEGFKTTIEQIRTTTDTNKRDELKKQLPGVTVSGLCDKGRKKEQLTCYSRLMQIDLDKIENLAEVRAKLEKDKYCYAVFLSPSGNGLKIIFRVENDLKKHQDSFFAIEKYFLSKYGLQIDKSCKDITRLMFLSHDENLFVNENAIIFSENEIQEKIFEKIFNDFNKKEKFIDGKRNNYIFKLASKCAKNGISLSFTELKLIEKFEKNDFPASEIKNSIKSAYSYPQNIKKNNAENKKSEEKAYSKIIQVEKYLNDKYEFRNNIVSTKIEFRAKNSVEPFKELNENNVYCDLARNNLEISIAKLMSLLNSDFIPVFNPFTYYFKNLKKWDAKTEIDFIEKLCSYIPVKDVDRFKKQFKKMLVRCIACALEEDIFNKQALILVHSQQNSGKSSFCRWLCPPALKGYFTEHVTTDKDGQIILATMFLINLDELAALASNRTEINALKSLISRDKINVRLPYESKTTVKIRRANFIGSTNNDEFLTDVTGSVRWLCFELTGQINFDYTEMDINDIWRQAYTLYVSGFKYQLTTAEVQENEIVNKQYIYNTSEMDLIPKYFKPGTKEQHELFLTATDILHGISKQNLNVKLTIQNTGKALKLLGYERGTERLENSTYPVKGYYINNRN